ncbi:pilus assembly protein [Myxococcota bacterium]|nr:pilus assembly protein [Myxococcota bacterium]
MVLNRRARRGSNIIEFALILPVFVALFTGIMEFSWVFFLHAAVVNAVRDGCRAGAVTPQTDSPDTAAITHMTYLMSAWSPCGTNPSLCNFTAVSQGSSPEESLVCTIDFTYEPLVGMVPAPERMTATATVLFELQD